MNDDGRDEDEFLRLIAGGDMRALETPCSKVRVRVFALALAVTAATR